MKYHGALFILLSFYNLWGQETENSNDSFRILNVSQLQEGDTIIYKNILISCMSGIRSETLDSITFYRNDTGVKAIYRNLNLSIREYTIPRIVAIEKEMWNARNLRATGYYQYSYKNKSSEVLVHHGEKNFWHHLI